MAQGGVSLITNTIVRGRRLRGHFNMPGPTETFNQANGLPTAGYQTTIAAASANLITDTDPQLVVWSRPTLDGTLVIAGSTGAVSAVIVAGKFFTLRSRRD
jgi:hypothetical protein